MGLEFLLGLCSVLIRIGEERVFADHAHEDGGDVKSPASIVQNHSLDMVNGERDDSDSSDECAAVSALEFDDSIDDEMGEEGHPDIQTVDIELKGRAKDE